MKTINWTIFIGFMVSGSMFFSAMEISNLVGEGHWSRNNLIPFMLGFGVLVGWFCTVAGLLNVIFGIAFRISGRLTNFWKSLYPVNFGLSILAMLIMSDGLGF